ncbi:MAG: polysulfide reductase NrfD [Candidatus Thiodiazotropha sp. (ex Epidulcina cf. delphinae)]|nr:polysulfide reductase NrfD [Candidatus Thiodiazotropha sp. (ex Epidulcina cf. delphinae)]
MQELTWGWPIIIYLFLAGMGAGAYTVSASVLLRGGGGFGRKHFQLARYGALLAPIPIIIGTAFLILELGTFMYATEASMYFRWLNLFTTFEVLSPMSWGAWILGLGIIASVVYAYTFLKKEAAPGDEMSSLRRALAWVGVPLGIAIGVYTGVLLGAMPSRPFWNTSILPFLFLVSSLSTGAAGITILKAVFSSGDVEEKNAAMQTAKSAGERDLSDYLLNVSDLLLLGLEVLGIFLLILFAYMMYGDRVDAIAVIMPGGSLFSLFWWGVIVLGVLVPSVIELKYTVPTLLHGRAFIMPRNLELSLATFILLGGLMLRYVVVVAGQITGPVGI